MPFFQSCVKNQPILETASIFVFLASIFGFFWIDDSTIGTNKQTKREIERRMDERKKIRERKGE